MGALSKRDLQFLFFIIKFKFFFFCNFFQRTNDTPIQLQQLIEKPLQVSTKDPNLKDVGWFQPVTDDPIYSWVWTDMNYDEDAEEFHEGLALS